MNIAVVASKGAPGVTTLACALAAAWPERREVVVVECDPSGGDLAARFQLDPEPGVASMALGMRQGSNATDHVSQYGQSLPGGLNVIVGPLGADAALAIDRELTNIRITAFEHVDAIFDCGRLLPHASGQAHILAQADRVFVVMRPDTSSVVHGEAAIQRVRALRGSVGGVGVVTIGEGIFEPRDVADALAVELVAILPSEPAVAAMLAGGKGRSRALHRSDLIRTAARMSAELVGSESQELRDAS